MQSSLKLIVLHAGALNHPIGAVCFIGSYREVANGEHLVLRNGMLQNISLTFCRNVIIEFLINIRRYELYHETAR